jgi:putative RNA 2'-phosphotransferase
MPDLVRLSKLLAVMLRHKPDEFGLTLDADGFADTDAVWKEVERRYPGVYSHADLLKVVEGDGQGKKRYEMVGERIRALYGHSTGVPEVTYPPAVPPDVLYHGTPRNALDAIRRDGLKALSRQYVHLTSNVERARTVGTRHGAAVILTIRAGEAHRDGVIFYHPEPEHYLVTALPPQYIVFPES